jgi:hypothetical protein
VYADSVELINSSDIFVDSSSSNITLINSRNVQVIGALNFTGIGLEDVIVDSSYSGKTINTNTSSLPTEVTTPSYLALETDTVLVCLNDTEVSLLDIAQLVGKEIVIKNSSSGVVEVISYFEVTGGLLIEGDEKIYIQSGDSVTLLNTGTNFIII